jgi:hypothetical protein
VFKHRNKIGDKIMGSKYLVSNLTARIVLRVTVVVGTILLFVILLAGHAKADPICGGEGLPPCAGPGDPATVCAWIAWRTMTPCNYWGMQVPQGTPGSWG